MDMLIPDTELLRWLHAFWFYGILHITLSLVTSLIQNDSF